MIELKVETAELEMLVEHMADRIQSFVRGYAGPELVEWQLDDMHRRYPNVEYTSNYECFTLIWPRSRTYEEHRPSQSRTQRRIRRAPSPRPSVGSHRPILREELFERLQERVQHLMEEKISWDALGSD